MKSLSGRPRGHNPDRTCVACRGVFPKQKLIRVARTTEGVKVDLSGREPGRGAYLCPSRICWVDGISRGRIEKALRVKLDSEAKDRIMSTAPNGPGECGPSNNERGVGSD